MVHVHVDTLIEIRNEIADRLRAEMRTTTAQRAIDIVDEVLVEMLACCTGPDALLTKGEPDAVHHSA